MIKNVKDITDLKDKLITHYSKAHEAMRQARDYYDLKLKNIPSPSVKFASYTPPTARSIVDKAVDHIIVSNPIITVPPRKESEKAQEQADKLEKFYVALLKRIDAQLKEALFRTAAKNGLLYGMYAIKGPCWDSDAYGNVPKRREGEKYKDFEKREGSYNTRKRLNLPILATALDPLTVLVSPDAYPPNYVLEVTTKKGEWVREKWGVTDIQDGEVDWIEYWDNEQRAFLCDGKFIKELEPNIYGYIPYLVGYSGLGYASEKPEDEIVGLLNPVFSALEAEARAKIATDYIVQRHAYPVFWQNLNINIDLEPGAMNYAPDGYKVSALPLPQTLPDLYRVQEQLSADIERATYSDVIQGIHPQGVSSGYQEAILVGQARLKFGPMLSSLETQGSEFLSRVARLIEIVNESITVWAYEKKGNIDETISPEDIQGYYTVYLQLSAVSPEEADRRAMLGLNLYKAGTISLRYFLEHYAMIPNASEEIKQMMIELVVKENLKPLALAAAQKWGTEEFRQTLESVPSTPPTEGVETTPGVPPRPATPGSAQEQDLAIRQMQRLGAPGQGAELGSSQEEAFR